MKLEVALIYTVQMFCCIFFQLSLWGFFSSRDAQYHDVHHIQFVHSQHLLCVWLLPMSILPLLQCCYSIESHLHSSVPGFGHNVTALPSSVMIFQWKNKGKKCDWMFCQMWEWISCCMVGSALCKDSNIISQVPWRILNGFMPLRSSENFHG